MKSLRPLDRRSRAGRPSTDDPRRDSDDRPCRLRRRARPITLAGRQILHNLHLLGRKVLHNRPLLYARSSRDLAPPLTINFGDGISDDGPHRCRFWIARTAAAEISQKSGT
jgi:hypothetical protein